LVPHADGGWVRWSPHKARVEELEAERGALLKIIREARGSDAEGWEDEAAVALVADTFRRADKAEARVEELEGELREVKEAWHLSDQVKIAEHTKVYAAATAKRAELEGELADALTTKEQSDGGKG